jgi:hypothetical protein
VSPSNQNDYAQQLADRIQREFNDGLSAFMGRVIERRRAEEFQRRYDALRGRATAA